MSLHYPLFVFGLKRSVGTGYRPDSEVTARDADDVMKVLRSDYGNAYFVTGM